MRFDLTSPSASKDAVILIRFFVLLKSKGVAPERGPRSRGGQQTEPVRGAVGTGPRRGYLSIIELNQKMY